MFSSVMKWFHDNILGDVLAFDLTFLGEVSSYRCKFGGPIFQTNSYKRKLVQKFACINVVELLPCHEVTFQVFPTAH